MKIKIQATKTELVSLYVTIIMLFLASFLVGGFLVGHQASSLIGYINVASIPDNSIGSAKITNFSIQAADIADAVLVDRLVPNGVITSSKIALGGITAADIMDNSINSTKITNIDWAKVINKPGGADYGGIGYQVPASTTCTHPTKGLQTLTPHEIEIFNRYVVVLYNWTTTNVSQPCPPAQTYEEYYCNAHWFGVDAFKNGCFCSTDFGIPCS